MEIFLCITGFSKPWLTSACVYSLCLTKLLASYSSSCMCQGAGTPDHCVSTPDPWTQHSADKYPQLSPHCPSDPDAGRDFWAVLPRTTLILEIMASDKSSAWPVWDLSYRNTNIWKAMVTLGENSHCSSQNKPASSPSSLGTILGGTWRWDASRILMSPLDLPI